LSVIFVIIGYSILFLIDGYPVLMEKKTVKILPYSIIFLVAFLLNLLAILKIKIPSPAKGIERIIMLIIGE
jgi:NADH:ubiquinone oxidoreductase subunit K